VWGCSFGACEQNSERMSDDFGALTVSERRGLQELVESKGERATCAELGIPRATLARLLAGLRVRRGTVALARVQLNAQEACGAT
jgi:hypothetical protein